MVCIEDGRLSNVVKLSPRRIPPNVKFEVDDIESPWIHPEPFDFIFSRYMAVSIGDWRTLIGRIFE